MIAQLIIPYCHYYKGESFPPERLKGEYSEILVSGKLFEK